MINDFKNGDKQVLKVLYNDLFPSLRRWVLSNSGNALDAEDLFHDALVVVYRKLHESSFSIDCELGAYLFAVAKKLWLQKLRRRKVEDKYEAFISKDISENEIETLIEDADILKLYTHYFNKLDTECRKLLEFVFDGKSMLEIMEWFNFNNESHARKKKFRCKNKLIEMITNDPKYKELKKN